VAKPTTRELQRIGAEAALSAPTLRKYFSTAEVLRDSTVKAIESALTKLGLEHLRRNPPPAASPSADLATDAAGLRALAHAVRQWTPETPEETHARVMGGVEAVVAKLSAPLPQHPASEKLRQQLENAPPEIKALLALPPLTPAEQAKLHDQIRLRARERELRERQEEDARRKADPVHQRTLATIAKIRAENQARYAAEKAAKRAEEEAAALAEAERAAKVLAQRGEVPYDYEYYVAGYIAARDPATGHRKSFRMLVQPATARLEALGVPADYYLGAFDDDDEDETAYFRKAVHYVNQNTPKLDVVDANAKRTLDWMTKKGLKELKRRVLKDSMGFTADLAGKVLNELLRTGHLVQVGENKYIVP
jgi:hypothetical protein